MKWSWPKTAIAFCSGFLFVKCFFGVDFTDESFYASLPYRFFLGDRPFIDEIAVHQTSAFLTYPVLWLNWFFTGSATSGIILIYRLAYWTLITLTAFAFYKSLRQKFPETIATSGACALIAYVPLGLPSLSYNTLGSTFLFLALLTMIYTSDRRMLMSVLRGLFIGLASVAYPTLILLAPFAIIWPVYSSKDRVRLFFASAIAVAVGLLPLIIPILTSGIPALLESFKISSSIDPKGGGLEKIVPLAFHLWHNFFASLVPFAIAAAVFKFWQHRWARTAGALIFFVALVVRFGDVHLADLLNTTILLAPFLSVKDSPLRRQHPYFVPFVISLLGGLVMAWSSGAGAVNFHLGALFAAIIAILSLDKKPYVAWAFIGLFLISLAGHSYRDLSPWKLQVKVNDGPYAGLMTSEAKASYLASLQAASDSLKPNVERIVFVDDLPAGYLLTDLRPGICSTWAFTPWNPERRKFRSAYVECMRKYSEFKTGIVQSAKNVRSPVLADAESFPDPLTAALAGCAEASTFQDPQNSAFILKPNCL